MGDLIDRLALAAAVTCDGVPTSSHHFFREVVTVALRAFQAEAVKIARDYDAGRDEAAVIAEKIEAL